MNSDVLDRFEMLSMMDVAFRMSETMDWELVAGVILDCLLLAVLVCGVLIL